MAEHDHLVSLILDDMAAATNQDLATDGDVPQGDDSAEGKVWAKIEAEAQRLRDAPRRATFRLGRRP